MSEPLTAVMVPYMMGSTTVDEVFDKALSGLEREEKLSSAIFYFEKALEALKAAPDLDMEQECHRRLGLTLLYLYFRDPVEIAESGLSEYPDLKRAVEELETALDLETKVQEKMFTDRNIASAALLPLDTIWMYQSMQINQQSGPQHAVNYLESKVKLLDQLGGVNLPGTCSMLHTHYLSCLESQSSPSSYDSFKADDFLNRAASGETYEDVAAGTRFCIASSHYKKKAQEKKDLYHSLEQKIHRAMFHFQEGLKAKNQRDFDKAIAELDDSILAGTSDSVLMEVDPRAADVAMSAYFELAAVILIKFNLLNKANVTDEEFLWFGRAIMCAKRQVEIYDKFIIGTDRASDKLELYKKAKQLVSMEMRFLTHEKNGKTEIRNTTLLDTPHLPTVRCLAEEEDQQKEFCRIERERRVREKRCIACGQSLGVLDKMRGKQRHPACI